jgi:hypothetical protein
MKYFDVTVVGELNLDSVPYGLPEALPAEREVLASSLAVTLGRNVFQAEDMEAFLQKARSVLDGCACVAK